MRRAQRQLRIGGGEVLLQVRRSARARRARILVAPGKPPEVVVPERMSEREVDRVIREHRGWIAEKVAWARDEAARTPQLGLDRPGVVWLAGSPVPVELHGSGRAVAKLVGGRLRVAGPAEGAGAAIGRWYRREARLRLTRATSREAEALGVEPARISIRDPRTRWGSCSATGAISYSWRLVICPEPVLDYVVVHELCHLRFHDHSPSFWGLLSAARPEWREQADWLRRHGPQIGGYAPRPC
jgi:predicted metal-dependent hydrolase